jgi:hypothetical protein
MRRPRHEQFNAGRTTISRGRIVCPIRYSDRSPPATSNKRQLNALQFVVLYQRLTVSAASASPVAECRSVKMKFANALFADPRT